MRSLALFGAVACIASSGLGHAETSKNWGSVGNWNIVASGAVKDAFCMAWASYNKGTVVFISVVPNVPALRMTLLHERWKSIKDGKEYAVELYFDGVRSNGKMVGSQIDSIPAIEATLTQVGVARFAKANVMTIVHNGELVAKLSLGGTSAALDELRKCQLATNAAGWPSADNPPDPFR